MAVSILLSIANHYSWHWIKNPALKGTKKEKEKCLEWFLQILVVLSQGWSIEIRALGCNLIKKELWNRMEDKGPREYRRKKEAGRKQPCHGK